MEPDPPLTLAARIAGWWTSSTGSTYAVAQLLFGRLLGLVCFVAFASLWAQLDGLYGPHGILPIEDLLSQAAEWGRREHRDPRWVVPSIFWLTGASSTATHAVCGIGLAASGALFLGIASRLAIVVLWVTYLSFVATGQVFMGYQWDALLLEALFVGFFFVPWSLLPSRRVPRLPAGRWLVWVLVAKLMFLSGYVKLAADPVWRDLTALNYHLWTQPIPNFAAWHVAGLPDLFKAFAVIVTLLAETVAPLCIFAPRRVRHPAALLMIVLQLGIMATGTFGFFNLLTIALCITLFDDAAFGRWGRAVESVEARGPTQLRYVALIVFAPLVVLSSRMPDALRETLGPFRTFNSYGLFATMTRDRPEVIVEWSVDGTSWTAYDFHYKPTEPTEPLRATTVHMPRLDWQMWFAALLGCERSPWLRPFAARLLEAAPEVHGLLAGGYPEQPPRFVRMRAFQYRFGSSVVWEREQVGPFCPTFTLDEHGALVRAGQR